MNIKSFDVQCLVNCERQILVFVPYPSYCSSTHKIPVILPKVQVAAYTTVKYTCTLRMWLCMEWHCTLVYGLWCTQNMHLDRQHFHTAPAMYQPNSTVSKPLCCCNHSFRITCNESAVGLLESKEYSAVYSKPTTTMNQGSNPTNNKNHVSESRSQMNWNGKNYKGRIPGNMKKSYMLIKTGIK